MLQALVNLIFYIIELIANLIFTPIISLLTKLFPDISTYAQYVTTFLNIYVWRYMAFAKSLFMNSTGFPDFLFNAIVAWIAIKIAIHAGMQTYRFIMEMWRRFKP